MFFPLGLGFKIKSFPLATWLIILACTLYYALGQQNAVYNKEYMALEGHFAVERAHDHLFYEYCHENLENGLCEQFALERGLYFERQEEIPFFEHDVDASPRAIMEFMRLYEEFAAKLKRQTQEVKALPSYSLYAKNLERLKRQTQEIRERHHLLHHDNLTIPALLNAIFSHENLWHLAGNMLFLFIFGRYVEHRTGSLAYFLSYIVLGSLALAIYASLNQQPFLHVLGASANVSVVMGAFYTLFFNHKIKIFFFYLAIKIAEFPVKTYMFFFFMLQEFVFSATSSDSVAYTAHALGLVFGMGFGLVWGKSKPVPKEFLYEDEVREWEAAKRENTRAGFVDKAVELLKYNPNNKIVIRAAVKEIAPENIDIAGLDLDEELILRELMPGYLRDLAHKNEFDEFFKTLAKIPRSWSMPVCLREFGQKELLGLIDRAIDEKRLMPAVLLIQAFAERYKRSPKLYNLLKTLKSILNHMPLTQNRRKSLSKIMYLSSSDGVKKTINARLAEDF